MAKKLALLVLAIVLMAAQTWLQQQQPGRPPQSRQQSQTQQNQPQQNQTQPSQQASRPNDRSGSFDYYVLSLSWSPTYCAGDAGQHDDQQCAPGRRFAFVVHGLWPQYTKGWPQDCSTAESWVPQDQIDAMMDIMPSKKLIIHEWKKHGTCAGLTQADYFSTVRAVFDKVRIPARYLSPGNDITTTPAQIVTDFVQSNRDLTANMLDLECGNARDAARLSELRICLTTGGAFTACGANETNACRASSLVLPHVR